MQGLSQRLDSFIEDTEGAATIEFVIVAPILFFMVFSIFEAGWLMTKQMMLTRGLNMAVRELRIGDFTPGSQADIYEEIKQKICDRAKIFRDCEDSIHLQMQTINLATGIPWTPPTCVDRDPDAPIQPIVFSTGARGVDSDTMFIRACVIVDPMLPGTGLGAHLTKDATGGYQMVAFQAFRNEP